MRTFENFISYRRSETQLETKTIFDALIQRGHPTFCDVYSLGAGEFGRDIEHAIRTCQNFLLVLSATSLDRCADPNDWMRREIQWALEHERNVVLVFVGPVAFPQSLPPELRALEQLNGLTYEVFYFESFCDRLVSQFLAPPSSETAESNTTFEIDDGVLVGYVGSGATVVVPPEVRVIADSVFKDCTEIEQIVLPQELTTIGDSAFERCLGLSHVALPDAVEQVGSRAFHRCYGLAYIAFNERLTSLGSEALAFCTSLKILQISNGLMSFDPSAVNDCTKLGRLLVDESHPTLRVLEGVVYSKDLTHVVRCPPALASSVVVVPSEVTAVGPSAFAGCRGLDDVVLPVALETIGAFAFKDCTGLKNLVLPDGLRQLESTAIDGWVDGQDLSGLDVDALKTELSDDADFNDSAHSEKSLYCLVVTTFESLHEAEEMARRLLDHRLIASGQIVPVRSMYWWADTQHAEDEFQLTCFTSVERYRRIEAVVRKSHSYEVCQIVQIPLGAVSAPFAEWISSAVWRGS